MSLRGGAVDFRISSNDEVIIATPRYRQGEMYYFDAVQEKVVEKS